MKITKMEIMEHHLLWLRILLFILCSAACLLFVGHFMQAGDEYRWLEWESASVATENGEKSLTLPVMDMRVGDTYTFTTTLHEMSNSPNLIFAQGPSRLTLSLNGKELYQNTVMEADMLITETNLSLPPDSEGGLLTLTYESLASGYGDLPIFRLQDMAQIGAQYYGYANLTGIPTGFYGMAFLGLAALMLLGRRFRWQLLPLSGAFAVLTAGGIVKAQGYFFLPERVSTLATNAIWGYLPLLLLLGHLVLNYKRMEKRILLQVGVLSIGAVLVLYLFSLITNNHFSSSINTAVSQLLKGYPEDIIYWLTNLTVFYALACAILETMHEAAVGEAERRALSIRENAAREAYAALNENARYSAQLKHEWKNRFTAMSAMLRDGETEKLTQTLQELMGETEQISGTHYTNHFLINTILQKYAFLVAKAGVSFQAAVSVPEKLGIEDVDLSAFLMNLLDNALEATETQDKSTAPFIELKMQINNGFLTINCKNSCDRDKTADEHGNYPTTKTDKTSHGFGLKQMRRVAEKYKSVLVIESRNGIFTVKTALALMNAETTT